MANVIKTTDTLQMKNGRKLPDELNTTIRRVRAFEPLQGTTKSIERPTNVMLDKRGPGLWQGIIGGPKSKVEHLAELMVSHSIVEDVATSLMDGNLLRSVNDKIVRNNQRFRAGVFTMDYASLFKAVAATVGSGRSATDPKRHVTRVITELISRAYTKMAVMVPFVGAVELLYEAQPIATTKSIIHAANVAAVAEVLEAIDLAINVKDAKEFSPVVTEGLLGPQLTQAASRLMATVRYVNYMRDTAVLVGRYLAKPGELPDHVRDNADLTYLATNASFALDAIQMADNMIVTPDFDLREAISYTVTRLRELKRFETISLDRFAEMYTHQIVHAPSGYVSGVSVHRNEVFNIGSQVSKFVDREDYYLQSALPVAEAYLTPITEAINRAFGDGMLIKTVDIAAQHLITRLHERDDDSTGGYLLALNMSEEELRMYALAFADRLYVVNQEGTDGNAVGSRIIMGVSDNKTFYEALGLYSGNEILVDDPAEVLILSGKTHEGTGTFPARPQSILDDLRYSVLADLGPENLMLQLDKSFKFDLPMFNKKKVVVNQSLQHLLGLESLNEIHYTVNLTAADLVTNAFATLTYIHDYLQTSELETDKMLAHQVAVATHTLYGRVASNDAVIRLMRTIFTRVIQDPLFTTDKNALRAHLSATVAQQRLALSTTSMLLLKTGLLQYGLQEDISQMFNVENVAEIAATAESWYTVMKPINN